MKTRVRQIMVVTALFLLLGAVMSPLATATELSADPVVGCTITYVATATDPQSDAGQVASNPKFWLSDGIHIYPSNAVGYADDVATWELSATYTWVDCVV